MKGISLILCFCIFDLLLISGCSIKNEKRIDRKSDSIRRSEEIDQSAIRTQKKMIIYGSMQCVHCHQLRRQLDAQGIEYEFRDVDESDVFFQILQNKLKEINFKGYVRYPVIDIEGEILVNPEFEEVVQRLIENAF
jgi:glutaredoxin